MIMNYALISYTEVKTNGELKKNQGAIVKKYRKLLSAAKIKYVEKSYPVDYFAEYPGKEMVQFMWGKGVTS